jgi:hypothetical protein
MISHFKVYKGSDDIVAAAIAAAQRYARETNAIALAAATEFSLAATLHKLLATLSNWRKYCQNTHKQKKQQKSPKQN